MKYIAIDYGKKRTGIAISDFSETFAFPRVTLQMRGKDIFFAELLSIIQEEKIEGIVVGLPLRLDRSDSETTRMVRNMVARLQRRCSLPVYYVEESLSSYEAEQHLREVGKRGKTTNDILDQAAAVIILSSFLSLPAKKRRSI